MLVMPWMLAAPGSGRVKLSERSRVERRRQMQPAPDLLETQGVQPGRMTMLKVRVEVADTPGALAGITAALAALEVDVAAIDVLEVDGRSVVDEMILRLPGGVTVRDVQRVLRSAGAAEVLSSRVSTPAVDQAVAAFELTRAVVTAPGDAAVVGRCLARAAKADTGALIEISQCTRFPLAMRALERGVPTTGPAGPNNSPLALATGWTLWIAPQVSDPQHLGVVGRRLNVRFAATEAARLRAFVTLLEAVARQRLMR